MIKYAKYAISRVHNFMNSWLYSYITPLIEIHKQFNSNF